MDKKDFSNLEDQIVSTVSNALKAIDFANLKKDINDKKENTLNQFKPKFDRHRSLNKKSKNNIAIYISKRPVGSISGILCTVLGASGSLVFSFFILVFLLFNTFFNSLFSSAIIGGSIIFGVLLLFFAISLYLLLRGVNLIKRLKRFKKYVKFIGNNSYFSIKDLSKLTKDKESFVVKDLSKMINLGMFLEGHIDEEKTYFMLSDEVYSDYLNLKKQQKEKENNNKLNEEIYDSKREEIESTIKIGRDYIEQIKNIKNNLYKEEIAIKLGKLEDIASKILYQVEKEPKKIQEVNKFINHYLPITIKLINSYKELNSQLVQGDNIRNAKIEIEKSVDLINNAFENLLDDLFEDIALDISTDISVLKTLFKQDGLTEEDFKK
ncbi:MAG: 5-bromo-4-chloroindolyl phosphate hydrolysis family protein [Romboutsia sp.]|uniref:5-bromo-4-chloroindolyl phosphate hydrolysis family protein n=1 Tax=Romboutsia sp. TaxID=1965302 RepID=UPI003F368F9C